MYHTNIHRELKLYQINVSHERLLLRICIVSEVLCVCVCVCVCVCNTTFLGISMLDEYGRT
jgi:hypothetical protein